MTAKNVDGAEGRFTESDRSSPHDRSLKRGARPHQARHIVKDAADEILDRVQTSWRTRRLPSGAPPESTYNLFTQATSPPLRSSRGAPPTVRRTATLKGLSRPQRR